MEKKQFKELYLITDHHLIEVYNAEIDPVKEVIDNPKITDIHHKQGFAWRQGKFVTFLALCNWQAEIRVSIENQIRVDEKVVRSIIVPFYVGERGIIVDNPLEGIDESNYLAVPKGSYELLYNAIPSPHPDDDPEADLITYVYELIFIPSDSPRAKIIKADDKLSAPEELVLD